MSKTLIVLLSVVAIGLCLRTGHLQADGPEYPAPIPVDPVPVPVGTTTSTDPSQQPSSPSGPEDFPPEYTFINNLELKKLLAGLPLSSKEIKDSQEQCNQDNNQVKNNSKN